MYVMFLSNARKPNKMLRVSSHFLVTPRYSNWNKLQHCGAVAHWIVLFFSVCMCVMD